MSNALTTNNVYATTANTFIINTPSLLFPGTIGGPGSNLNILGNVFVSNALSTTNLFVTGTLNTATINTTTLIVSSNLGIGTASTQGANLYVQGNALVSNALSTTNVFASGYTNVATINSSSLIFASNVGISTSVAQGATLFVQGNAFVSNSLSATNVFIKTSMNCSTINTSGFYPTSLAVGSSSVQGATLFIQGNAFVSNSLTTTNVYCSGTLNTATLNTTTLIVTRNVGIGTVSAQGANLFVQGNIYASNALTINNVYVSGTLNVTTLNTFSVIFSSNVGIGTASAGTTNLYVQGNVYVNGTVAASNIISSNLIYTIEDLTRRSPHLAPNAANGPIIQAWISGTCNASSQPTRSWWGTSLTPDFSNISTTSKPGYQGGLFLPDGRVLFVPSYTTSIGFYQSKTQTFSTTSVPGLISGNFANGVLLPNGNVIFCPQTSSVGLYNPISSSFSNNVSLPGGSYCGVLSPTGNVIFTPTGVPSNIIHWNYTTSIQTNCYSLSSSVIPSNPWSYFSSALAAVTWMGIAWSPQLGIFCAVAQNGPSAISSDGINWTVGTSTVYAAINVEWSPDLGVFCMRVYQTTSTATSQDGLTWSLGAAQSTAFSQYDPSITAWSSQLGLFCSVGTTSQGGAATSRDGLTWTPGSVAPNDWGGIAWSPQLGVFCVVSRDSYPTSATSRDGLTWTTSTSLPHAPGGAGTGWNSIAWSPQLGLFCAIYSQSPSTPGGYMSATSPDGLTWSTTTNLPSQQWSSIAWSPQLGLFCAVVNNTSGAGYAYSAMSPDGVNWTNFTNLPANNTSMKSIAWSPSLGVFCVLSAGRINGSAITSGIRSVIQSGSVLLPNGNVIAASPGSSNVIQYNPSTQGGSNLYVGTAGFNGLVLAPNGNVIGVPQNSNIIVINPSNFTSSNISLPRSNVTFFGGGCLIPSGNIIFAPSLTLSANVGSSNVGMFDPRAMTFSNSSTAGAGFTGATLIPNGQVVFCPTGLFDTMTPVSTEFCMSPYFNKF